MIPPFDDSGFLPPGVHPATWVEVEARFGRESELRRTQMESVRWMVGLAVRAGVRRIVLNGSFVTDIMEPNDVDCVLLLAADYPRDAAASGELAKGLPFLEILRVEQPEFDRLVQRFFATDRHGLGKGMIEISL
jgi:anti-sigma factor RsiW